MYKKNKNSASIVLIFLLLIFISFIFLAPIFIVLMNSFKGKLYISNQPFAFPDAESFAGLKNFTEGIAKTGFIQAFWRSLFITVVSVLAINITTSMTAWYIARHKNKFTNFLYYMFVFSMVVPFQMVMFTMSKLANTLNLGNPLGIVLLYIGFGAGMSVFMFVGFIKSIPIEIEEAAMIDGCSQLQTFFLIVRHILKPTSITIAILNAMWVWNDYLLPNLVLQNDKPTIPMAVQYLKGGYGSIDMGAMMAMLVLSIIPIVIFYIFSQKYIIEGVVAGAVKG